MVGCGVTHSHLFGGGGGEHCHLHEEHGCRIVHFISDNGISDNPILSVGCGEAGGVTTPTSVEKADVGILIYLKRMRVMRHTLS